MARSTTTTNTLGTLEIASACGGFDDVPNLDHNQVRLTTAYIRDWGAILSDVMAAINFRSEFGRPYEITDVTTQDNHDVVITFDSDTAAELFMEYIGTLETNEYR